MAKVAAAATVFIIELIVLQEEFATHQIKEKEGERAGENCWLAELVNKSTDGWEKV